MDASDTKNQKQTLLTGAGEPAECMELQTQGENLAKEDGNNNDQNAAQEDSRYCIKTRIHDIRMTK